MCSYRRVAPAASSAKTPSTPEPDFRPQRLALRYKPLTEQEKEQRRSQAAAWDYSGRQGTNPYQYMPQSRLDTLGKDLRRSRTNYSRNRRGKIGYNPYAEER